jgi:hypothetical protein
MPDKFVTEDHCDQVSKRIEEKVDCQTVAINNLIETLQPKLDMIVHINAWLRAAKWVITLLFGSGILFGILKAVDYIQKVAKK